MQAQDEDELNLSPEALTALADFAQQKGVAISNQTDPIEVRKKVEAACNLSESERAETFEYEYGPEIHICLQGWKRELGQRLHSTGLTMWRAAQDLASYLYQERKQLFGSCSKYEGGRKVLEVGAGLGLPGLLAAYLNPKGIVIMTDGDELTLEKLSSNIQANQPKNGCWVESSKLSWGRHDLFLSHYPDLFDLILAADVIYEQEAIQPLLNTVHALLRRSPTATFILAFARRNVSLDLVLEAAEGKGLIGQADDRFTCAAPGESVLRFRHKTAI